MSLSMDIVADAPAGGDQRNALGRHGEEIACRYLRSKGYVILEKNFRSRYGELDIIARQGGVITFVEVKTRRNRRFGEPFEAVTLRKQERVRRMASAWLMTQRDESAHAERIYRFDVISIVLADDGGMKTLEHIEDAF